MIQGINYNLNLVAHIRDIAHWTYNSRFGGNLKIETMKEFILFIRNVGDPIRSLSEERQQEHIQKIGGFIHKMVGEGKMKAAQPLKMQGSIISFENGGFTEVPFDESKEVVSGYYIIQAIDLHEAILIAKSDPRFEDGKWRIEVRQIMKIDGINE